MQTHPPAVLLRVGDPYCRDCFHEYFIHKFRAMLGKNRIIFPGEKVLLAVSGGPSSCSMLHQVQQGLSVNAHKKLRFTPGIVFIDEGAVTGRSSDDRQKTNAELKTLFESTGFPFHIIPLERVLELPTSVLIRPDVSSSDGGSSYKEAVGKFDQKQSCAAPPSSQQQEPADVLKTQTVQLQQLLASVKTLTAREELLHMLRQHLLLHTARTEGYSKLMLGDNCTRLAVKLLSSISLGRGAQAALDTGFSDSRYGLDFKASEKDISTIYRTSEKLQTACKAPSAVDSPRCELCLCELDTSAENASAFQATLISEQLSQNKCPQSDIVQLFNTIQSQLLVAPASATEKEAAALPPLPVTNWNQQSSRLYCATAMPRGDCEGLR
ncbi:hypothetical protein WMY93_031726 [Mugilogobius chulae]|uniref:Cytoplasmic tRNA 2-thiolation protein 2 n=1 Tax=Mugilogobius chulae TaxID=88201 RepID=A0AAW0MLF2_9GOBI